MKFQLSGDIDKYIKNQLFSFPYNKPLVHQIVNSYLISSRAGTKSQKNRSEVRGGGKKPWRQKGAGKARAGSINSPLWRTGAVTFAAKPKSYKQKVNKKMYSLALKTILSELYRQERLYFIDLVDVSSYKTKDFVSVLLTLGFSSDLLIVLNKIDPNLLLASRNLPKVKIVDTASLNPVDLVSYKRILFEKAAIDVLSERYLLKKNSNN